MYLLQNKLLTMQDTGLYSGYLSQLVDPAPSEFFISYKGGKINNETWLQIKNFLLWSFHTYKGEAQIRLFYNRDTNLWKAHPFEQTISNSLHTKETSKSTKNLEINNLLLSEGYNCAGTVHHHCEIDAFQSSTDYNDEINQNGLHITLGKLNETTMAIHARVSFRGVMYKCNIEEYFEEYPDLNTLNYSIDLFPIEWQSLLKEEPRYIIDPNVFITRHKKHKYTNNFFEFEEDYFQPIKGIDYNESLESVARFDFEDLFWEYINYSDYNIKKEDKEKLLFIQNNVTINKEDLLESSIRILDFINKCEDMHMTKKDTLIIINNLSILIKEYFYHAYTDKEVKEIFDSLISSIYFYSSYEDSVLDIQTLLRNI